MKAWGQRQNPQILKLTACYKIGKSVKVERPSCSE